MLYLTIGIFIGIILTLIAVIVGYLGRQDYYNFPVQLAEKLDKAITPKAQIIPIDSDEEESAKEFQEREKRDIPLTELYKNDEE
jgi:hypothetical protein